MTGPFEQDDERRDDAAPAPEDDVQDVQHEQHEQHEQDEQDEQHEQEIAAAPVEVEPVDDGFDLVAVLEAMMFASTEPLTIEEIRVSLPEMHPDRIENALDALARALDKPGRGLKLEKVAGGYRLVTRPDLAPSLRALFRFRNQKRLTPAALDVLAIVAYAQPITAPEIQEIRGTDPSYALRTLMDRQLVRMVGRKRVVGRPILYGTTREFLLHFGLDSLEDLPPVEGFGTRVVPAQGRLFPVTEEFDPLEGEAQPAGEDAGAEGGGEDADRDVPPADEAPGGGGGGATGPELRKAAFSDEDDGSAHDLAATPFGEDH